MSLRKMMVWTALALVGVACAPAIDTALEEQQLLDVDRAFAEAASAGQDVDSLVSFWAEDTRVVMPGEPVLLGRAAVREMVTQMLATPGLHITWTPEGGAVSQSGDLGYTFGTNAFTVTDSAGTQVTTKGRYLTVWRMDAAGRWRAVQDFTNDGPAEAPTP